MKSDNNLNNVLRDDGVPLVLKGNMVENWPGTNLKQLRTYVGEFKSWAARVALNENFGAVVICQLPGEGNRPHYHPDADEIWVILEGAAEYEIECANGNMMRVIAQVGDIIVVTKGKKHRITTIGTGPAVRLAITKPNVEYVYCSDPTDMAGADARDARG